MARKIYEIARDIRADWSTQGNGVNYAAKPYLEAMDQMADINGNYYMDSNKSVVLYFLANASSYRGEKARALKNELRALAGVK